MTSTLFFKRGESVIEFLAWAFGIVDQPLYELGLKNGILLGMALGILLALFLILAIHFGA